MGESSCVFQDMPLASQASTSERMAGALSALSESVSFGRFLSESLDWGRWSSFNQKKYIEEAERYSRPGSVAEKKAFFEARYKKPPRLRQSIALMEHSALSRMSDLDQQSEINFPCSKDDSVSRGRDESTVDSYYSATGDVTNFDLREEEGEMDVQKGEEVDQVLEDNEFTNSCSENVVTPNTTGKQPLQESSAANQPINDFSENIPRTPNLESTKIPKPSVSPSVQSTNKASRIHHTKENISSSSRICGQEVNRVERKRPTPKSVHASVNLSVGGGSTPSKADVKTKIARFEAVTKSSQSPMSSSKSAKAGLSTFVPKFNPQTPQPEPRKTSWDRRLSFSGRKTAAAASGNSSTENPRVASNKVDRSQAEATNSVSRKSGKKEENKDMAESELREFRRSLCFKARPLPDFYRKTETVKESNQKVTPMWSQSPFSTRTSSSKEKPSQNNLVPSQKPPLSRSTSCKNSTGAPNVASFSKDQTNKWTFTFSRR